MKIAVIIAKTNVANTFSIHDRLVKTPIIKSREVLAIKGPLKFPLNERRAGIININARKLSNGKIKKERIIPARMSPIIDIASDGKVSLTILPLVSRVSICHPHQNLLLEKFDLQPYFLYKPKIFFN